MMKAESHNVERITTGLTTLLEQLTKLQKDLTRVIREKLEAMRIADMTAMISSAQREGEIAAQVSKVDDQRKAIVGQLCEALKIPIPAHVENITLRVLLPHLSEKLRTRLSTLGNALREQMLEVAEANRVVEMVCREMLDHFKKLFKAFTQDDEGPHTYSRAGAKETGPLAKVLDAVG